MMCLLSNLNPLRGCNSQQARYDNTPSPQAHLIEHEDEVMDRHSVVSYSFDLLSRKKSCKSWRHSSSRTPAVIKQ